MNTLYRRQVATFLRPTSSRPLLRTYASKASTKNASSVDETTPESSCPSGTVLEGLAYLKDQPPVLALPDEEYPPWLWTILKPKEYPAEEQGPGKKAERARLRKENRERIKAANFMKTQ